MFGLLTAHRREFLAKTVMDVVKLAIGTGFVSGFFVQLPLLAQVGLLLAILSFFVLAWILFPPKGAH